MQNTKRKNKKSTLIKGFTVGIVVTPTSDPNSQTPVSLLIDKFSHSEMYCLEYAHKAAKHSMASQNGAFWKVFQTGTCSCLCSYVNPKSQERKKWLLNVSGPPQHNFS